jgi:hypothetical protein
MRQLTSLSTSLHRKYSKGLQSCELGGQISWDQWFFSVGLQPVWEIVAVSVREAFSIAAEVSQSADIFCN